MFHFSFPTRLNANECTIYYEDTTIIERSHRHRSPPQLLYTTLSPIVYVYETNKKW